MSMLTRPLTDDDLVATPDDFKGYEIIGAELCAAVAPIPEHQRLSGLLFVEFSLRVEPSGLGRIYAAPTDVVLGDHDIAEPDLVYVSTTRLNIVQQKFIQGPPDLVVDILSLPTRGRDETIKAALYARSGIAEDWVVDPLLRDIEVFTPRDGQYETGPNEDGRAHSIVLPGFAVDIAGLFARR